MNQAERDLMQRAMTLPVGKELRIGYADLWAAAGDGAAADPGLVQSFIEKIKRSWGVSVKKDAVWSCYTLVKLPGGKR